MIALTYYTCLPCYVGSGLQAFSNCKDLSFLHRSVSLVRSKPLQFGRDLTPQQHEQLVDKMIAVFESDLEAQKHGVKLTTEQLWNYRFVVQHMDVMLKCARADLDSGAFEMVSDAIKNGDALDIQFVSCLKGFVLVWPHHASGHQVHDVRRRSARGGG